MSSTVITSRLLLCRDCLRFSQRGLRLRCTEGEGESRLVFRNLDSTSSSSFLLLVRSAVARRRLYSTRPKHRPSDDESLASHSDDIRSSQPQSSSSSSTPPPPPSPPSSSSSSPPRRSLIFDTAQAASYLASRNTPTTFSSTYLTYSRCKKIFAACSRPGAYMLPSQTTTILPADRALDLGTGTSFWHSDLRLPPTFNTWAQLCFLHMWLVLVRVRGLRFVSDKNDGDGDGDGDSDGAAYARDNRAIRETVRGYTQMLADHFSHEADERMELAHGIGAKGIRTRYLKDLFIQWRGTVAAYDEGLVKGDAVLGAAVWRNLYGGSPMGLEGPPAQPQDGGGSRDGNGVENGNGNGNGNRGSNVTGKTQDGQECVDWRKVGLVVGWIRRVVRDLADVKGEDGIMEAVLGGTLFQLSESEREELMMITGERETETGNENLRNGGSSGIHEVVVEEEKEEYRKEVQA